MRRAAVFAVFLVAVLSPVQALAWTDLGDPGTTGRLGYTLSPPESWPVPNALRSLVGTSFDATATPIARAKSVEAYTGIDTDHQGHVEFTSQNNPADSVSQYTQYTFPEGQDFGFAIAYAHLKDPHLGRTANSPQYTYLQLNPASPTTYMAQHYAQNYQTRVVPPSIYGSNSYIMCYPNANDYGQAVERANVEPYSPFPSAAPDTAFTGLAFMVGEWNGSNGWNVVIRMLDKDGQVARGYYKAFTLSPYSGQVVVKWITQMQPSGWQLREVESQEGTSLVGHAINTEAITATNLEYYQAAVTTDSAQVDVLKTKVLSVSNLVDLPASASDTSTVESGGDFPSLVSGDWQDWFASNVTGPIGDAFDGFDGLLWFVDVLKGWFGIG